MLEPQPAKAPPAPCTKRARALGCICNSVANNEGFGWPREGKLIFRPYVSCPVHGLEAIGRLLDQDATYMRWLEEHPEHALDDE